MEWTRYSDVGLLSQLLWSLVIVNVTLGVCLVAYIKLRKPETVKVATHQLVMNWIIVSWVVWVGIGVYQMENWGRGIVTENENIIIDKAKEIYDPKKMTITETEDPKIYTVNVDGTGDYTFVVSDKGKNIDEIQKDGKVVYTSTEENHDEWLTDDWKLVAESIRKITGESEFKKENNLFGNPLVASPVGEYRVTAMGNTYGVVVDQKRGEVTSVKLLETELLNKEQ